MNKRFWRSRLSLELVLVSLLSLAVAAAVLVGARWALGSAIDRRVLSQEFQDRQETACAARLQAYVDEQRLSFREREPLDEWAAKERYVTLLLIRDGRLIYDSSVPAEYGLLSYGGEADLDYSYYPWYTYHTIRFADGSVQAQILCYYEFAYYNLANIASFLLGFLAFVFSLMLLIRRKVAYVSLLGRELEILEGGDLSYEITEQGRDELCELAHGVNNMRRAVVERQRDEEEARMANHALVTAMSHDLRTPLTALIGYLDILEMGRFGPGEGKRYLDASRKKAFQIKELSDKLFEYFLVYGKGAENLDLQPVDAMELVQQTVGESVFELEGQGFSVHWEPPEIRCTLLVDVDLFRRVVDNLFSNVRKYADPNHPVTIEVFHEDGTLALTVGNAMTRRNAAASTGIGLKTCAGILRSHGGSFESGCADGRFYARAVFPVGREPGE